MFLRTPRRKPNRRVLVHGLIYFGQMFADLMTGDGWDFRYYPDTGVRNLTAMARELNRCDIAYQIGGRVTLGKFLRTAKVLRKKRIVMHWVGSDTLDQQRDVAEGKAVSWVLKDVCHWAESDWMVREVQALGPFCELVPLPSALVPNSPSPLPAEFSVLVYMPDVDRSSLYGLDLILQVARQLPHIPFKLVGLLNGSIPYPPSNLQIHFYKQASVVWRPVRHDGLSFMVLESLGHGRHVLWSYPFPGCLQANCVEEAWNHISRLYTSHRQGRLEINWEGVQAVEKGGYLPTRLKHHILERLEQMLESGPEICGEFAKG